MGSIPGQGTKNPHAVGQLRPHITTRENLYAALKTQYSQNLNIYIYIYIYNLEIEKQKKVLGVLKQNLLSMKYKSLYFFYHFLFIEV